MLGIDTHQYIIEKVGFFEFLRIEKYIVKKQDLQYIQILYL